MGASGSKTDSLFQKVKDGTRGRRVTTVQNVRINYYDESNSETAPSTSASGNGKPGRDRKTKNSPKFQDKPKAKGRFKDRSDRSPHKSKKNDERPTSSHSLDSSDSDVDKESEIIDPGKYAVYMPSDDNSNSKNTFRSTNGKGVLGSESTSALAGSKTDLSKVKTKNGQPKTGSDPTTLVLGSWTGDSRKVNRKYYGPKTKINRGTDTVKKPQPPHPDLMRKVFHENIYLADDGDVEDVEECIYLDDPPNNQVKVKEAENTLVANHAVKIEASKSDTSLNKKSQRTSAASHSSRGEEERQNQTRKPTPQRQNVLSSKTADLQRKHSVPEPDQFHGRMAKPKLSGWTTNTTKVSYDPPALADVESSARAMDVKISQTLQKCTSPKPGTSNSSDTWQKQRFTQKKKKFHKVKTDSTLGMYQDSLDTSSSSEMLDENSQRQRNRTKSPKKKTTKSSVPKWFADSALRSQLVKSPNSLVKEMKEEGIIPLREVHDAREEMRKKHMADLQELTGHLDQSYVPSMDGTHRPTRLAPISGAGASTEDQSTNFSLIKQYGLRPSLRDRDNLTHGVTGSDDSSSS